MWFNHSILLTNKSLLESCNVLKIIFALKLFKSDKLGVPAIKESVTLDEDEANLFNWFIVILIFFFNYIL